MLRQSTKSLEVKGRPVGALKAGEAGGATEDLGSVDDRVHVLDEIVLLAESLSAHLAGPASGEVAVKVVRGLGGPGD